MPPGAARLRRRVVRGPGMTPATRSQGPFRCTAAAWRSRSPSATAAPVRPRAPISRSTGSARRSGNQNRQARCDWGLAAPCRSTVMFERRRWARPTAHARGRTLAPAAAPPRSAQGVHQTACWFGTSASTACKPVVSGASGASVSNLVRLCAPCESPRPLRLIAIRGTSSFESPLGPSDNSYDAERGCFSVRRCWVHSRPGRASSKCGHARYAAESGSKFRALAAPPRAISA